MTEKKKIWTYQQYVVHEFELLESTSSTAFEWGLIQKISDREIILTHQQLKGRGRYERNWQSPVGNLYFTMILRPNLTLSIASQLSFVAICALRLAIERLCDTQKINCSIQNKWPNDLLINDCKVAGLLLESKINGNDVEFVTIGIGVNITSNPQNTTFIATNLQSQQIAIERNELLKHFLDEFENLYSNWQKFGFSNIRKLWLKAAYNLNKEIFVKTEQRQFKAIFKDIDSEGNLLILDEMSNNLSSISSCEIFKITS